VSERGKKRNWDDKQKAKRRHALIKKRSGRCARGGGGVWGWGVTPDREKKNVWRGLRHGGGSTGRAGRGKQDRVYGVKREKKVRKKRRRAFEDKGLQGKYGGEKERNMSRGHNNKRSKGKKKNRRKANVRGLKRKKPRAQGKWERMAGGGKGGKTEGENTKSGTLSEWETRSRDWGGRSPHTAHAQIIEKGHLKEHLHPSFEYGALEG